MITAAEGTPPKNRRKSVKTPATAPAKQPASGPDLTIGSQSAPESASPEVKAPPIPYSWDRTQDEARFKQAPFPPVPGNVKKLPIDKFLEYFNTLPLQLQSHAVMYVQRWFPVTLAVTRVDDTGRRHTEHPSCAKYYGEQGAITEDMLVSRLGYGDFSFRLNDSRILNKSNPNAATVVYSEFKTKRDWAEHPPAFQEGEKLDMDDPSNAGYIAWARSRGILPSDSPQQKEDESEMANTAVVEKLLDQNQRLVERATQPAPAPPPAPVAPPASNDAAGAFKAMAEVLTAVVNKPAPAAADPMAMVQGIATVVQTLIPKPDHSSAELAKEVVKESSAANERVFKMQEQNIEQLRAEMAAMKNPTTTAVAPAVIPTRRQMLEDAVEEQRLLKTLGRGGSTEDPAADKASSMDKWLEAAPLIAPMFNGLIAGTFQTIHFFIKTWGEKSYNDALSRNGQPQPPATMNADQKQPEPGKPIQPQGPPPTAEQQQSQAMWNEVMTGMVKLQPLIIRFLEKGKSGAELAELVIEVSDGGRADYDRVRHVSDSLGKMGMQVPGANDLEKFTQSCRFIFEKIPALWAKVGNLPTMPQFLAEFYNYDEILKQAQGEDQ